MVEKEVVATRKRNGRTAKSVSMMTISKRIRIGVLSILDSDFRLVVAAISGFRLLEKPSYPS